MRVAMNERVSGIWLILIVHNIILYGLHNIRANVYFSVFHSTHNTYYTLLPRTYNYVVPAYDSLENNYATIYTRATHKYTNILPTYNCYYTTDNNDVYSARL